LYPQTATDRASTHETQKIKLTAKSLLTRLMAMQLKASVKDWYKDDHRQRRVKSAVEDVLAQNSLLK
jgi:type I restriction enzyme, R subunit